MAHNLSRRDLLRSGLAALGTSTFSAAPGAAKPPGSRITRTLPLVGVNLASAEFGTVPGQYEIDYIYPTARDVAYFADLGFNCIRLPFRWERLQPSLFSDFAPAEAARLSHTVRTITGLGLHVVLDPHNYAKRRLAIDNWATEHIIGSDRVPVDAFVDFWERLAKPFSNDPHVTFGLMNEPVGIEADKWLGIVNRTIRALRTMNAGNLVLVPGIAYTGAHSWLHTGNARMAEFVDPIGRSAIEVHQYFDANSSGKSAVAVSGSCGSDRLRDFQNWARRQGVKAFLGEFGAANNPTALKALADICQEMSANPDVWLGWTAWSAGPYWPHDYLFNLGPTKNGELRPQTRVLANHARPADPAYWVRPGAAIDIDLARDRTHGIEEDSRALAHSTAPSTLPGTIQATAPLLTVMQTDRFTLMIEVLHDEPPRTATALLALNGAPLLWQQPDGALVVTTGQGWQTKPRASPDWRAKQRYALSVDRPNARIAICVTGTRPLAGPAILPTLQSASLFPGPKARIVRVSVFPRSLSGRELGEAVA